MAAKAAKVERVEGCGSSELERGEFNRVALIRGAFMRNAFSRESTTGGLRERR